VISYNSHLRQNCYDHYNSEMKKVASGVLPLIAVNRNAPKALHRQIYDAYRAAIMEGRLRAGQRVPSTRVLAGELGISRIPLLNAYDQLLAEGYFESRIGAGTRISESLPDRLTSCEPQSSREQTIPSGPRLVPRRTAILRDTSSVPWFRRRGAFSVSHLAFDQFPFHVWSSLVTRHCRKMDATSLQYGDPMGSEQFRETIAAYLRTSRAVRCEAAQIMIVSGSQQALELSARVLLDPGSRVWVEEPGYSLTRNVVAMTGCELVPVPVDEQGLDVVAGIQRCPKARAAFVTPSHQYPLGVTMSATRRLQLLDWAQSSGFWIIEDDYDSEYRYASMPISSLQGLDGNSRVIYIGTFSKVLFPSLRLGYVVIPPDLVDRFLALRLATDLGPPGFHQTVMTDFIREGHFSRHIRRMRVVYDERRSALVECIRKEFGSTLDVLGGDAGMHLVVTLPKGFRDWEIAQRAARQNFWLLPLSYSYVGKSSRQGFVLGYGGTTVEDIPRAVSRLRDLLEEKQEVCGDGSNHLSTFHPALR
jgi:GntR family transcriptional regulator/MocR family aminotransferase